MSQRRYDMYTVNTDVVSVGANLFYDKKTHDTHWICNITSCTFYVVDVT